MSAFDGDLGPVEVKIIQETDEKKEEKDKVKVKVKVKVKAKARQKRLGGIGSVSLDVRTEGLLKPNNNSFKAIKFL